MLILYGFPYFNLNFLNSSTNKGGSIKKSYFNFITRFNNSVLP